MMYLISPPNPTPGQNSTPHRFRPDLYASPTSDGSSSSKENPFLAGEGDEALTEELTEDCDDDVDMFTDADGEYEDDEEYSEEE